jgi:hypothetical protein
MASETDFLNNALGKAGCSRITGIDDNSVEAGWCRTYYTSLRRSTQRMANWKFAGARLQLTQDIDQPAFGYTHSYGLPASMLKLRVYNGAQPNLVLADDPLRWQHIASSWRIEGRHLYSNDTMAYIEYIQDVSNPDGWDPLYYEMLASWLGSNLAVAVRKDHNLGERLLQQAMGTWMPMALAVDGQEASVSAYQSDDLIWGRNAV